jgi:hypothetical protein
MRGATILWKSAKQEDGRASPEDVIDALIERLQYEQGTEGLADDKKARALVHVLQAKAELEGRATEADDGTPIIE